MSLVTSSQSESNGPRLELLGAPRFVDASGAAFPLGPRLAPLVAVVALGGAIGRGQVAAMLYPELEVAEGRRNLRQLLHRQRPFVDAMIEHDAKRMALRPGIRVDALAEPGPDDAIGECPRPLLGKLVFEAICSCMARSPRRANYCPGRQAYRR